MRLIPDAPAPRSTSWSQRGSSPSTRWACTRTGSRRTTCGRQMDADRLLRPALRRLQPQPVRRRRRRLGAHRKPLPRGRAERRPGARRRVRAAGRPGAGDPFDDPRRPSTAPTARSTSTRRPSKTRTARGTGGRIPTAATPPRKRSPERSASSSVRATTPRAQRSNRRRLARAATTAGAASTPPTEAVATACAGARCPRAPAPCGSRGGSAGSTRRSRRARRR